MRWIAQLVESTQLDCILGDSVRFLSKPGPRLVDLRPGFTFPGLAELIEHFF